jgi:micrococcal nuclease
VEADLAPERSSTGSDRAIFAWAALLVLVAGAGCFPAEAGDSAEPVDGPSDRSASAGTSSDLATVDRVVDGDTLVADFGGNAERIRLIGIDAPESVASDQPVHCFGAEASAALAQLLPEGTTIRVERDVEARDRYDRLLLYVYRADDDLFVNRWLVANGFAEARSYRPNTAHQADLGRVRDDARAAGTGLWGVCDGPEQPLP